MGSRTTGAGSGQAGRQQLARLAGWWMKPVRRSRPARKPAGRGDAGEVRAGPGGGTRGIRVRGSWREETAHSEPAGEQQTDGARGPRGGRVRRGGGGRVADASRQQAREQAGRREPRAEGAGHGMTVLAGRGSNAEPAADECGGALGGAGGAWRYGGPRAMARRQREATSRRGCRRGVRAASRRARGTARGEAEWRRRRARGGAPGVGAAGRPRGSRRQDVRAVGGRKQTRLKRSRCRA